MKDFVPGPELKVVVRASNGSPIPTDRRTAGAPFDSAEAMRTALEREMEPSKDEGFWRAPPPVPDHELLQRIGTGAYGEVWLARNALGTLRAVKLVYRGRFEDERPFLREFHGILRYEPVSRSHESLVAVLHVGRNDAAGCFYYVMELADDAGDQDPAAAPDQEAAPRYRPRTLRTEMAQRQRLPPVEAAQLVLRLAGALAHLHAHGLVHRDIKPSNVIFVRRQPKLADIGLVTGAGDSRSFVGTEGFIPPEGPGTPQADLYGLGKLLYELVTGCDRLEFPQLPRELSQAADSAAVLELNEVIVRACSPDPRRRYESATELVSDLNLFLAGRSLRQVRKIENHLAWLKRLTVVGTAALMLTAGGLWVAQSEARTARQRERASQERAQAEAALRQRAEAAELEEVRLREDAQQSRANEARLRQQAEAQELMARKRAYASDMNLLQQALAIDDLGRAQELLDRQRPQPGQADLRGWEWRYFWQFCQSDAACTLCRRSNSVVSVSFSQDGTLLAAGTWDGELTVWDLSARRPIFQSQSSPAEPCRVAFAPGQDLLAFYARSNEQPSVVLWDSRRKTEARRLPLGGSLRNLAFTRDGHLFTCDLGGTNNVNEWEVSTGAVLNRDSAATVRYGMGTIFNVAAEGDRWIYAPDSDSHCVRQVTAGAGTEPGFRVAEELVTALAFSPDGRTLYTGEGYAGGDIKEWDLRARQLIDTFTGHRSWISCLKFLPDGRTLASASADHCIRLWDTRTRQLLHTLRGHNGELWTLDVSPDGHWLASGCKDGSVIIWDLTASASRPPPFRTLNASGLRWWAHSRDGRWCGVVRNRVLEFYDTAALELVGPAITNVSSFAFAPDMRWFVTSESGGKLSVWTFPARALVTNFVAHPTPNGGVGLAFLPLENTLLTFGADNLRKEWDTTTWREIRRWPAPSTLVANALAPRARLAAYGLDGQTVEVVELRDSGRRRQLTVQERLSGLAVSPDGATLAASSETGTVELWDTESLTRTALLHGVLLGYHSVGFSTDGKRLAAGSNGQEAIKLWDLDSHEELATLPGHGSFFSHVRFSSGGNTISACNWDGVIHFWTAPSWERIGN